MITQHTATAPTRNAPPRPIDERLLSRPAGDLQARLSGCGVDLPELGHRTYELYGRIETLSSTTTLLHYRKRDYDPASAQVLFQQTKAFLAIVGALVSLGVTEAPVPPPSVREVGWPGFVLATRDYAEAAKRMGVFMHHAPSASADDGLALALLEYLFPEVTAAN